MKMRVVAPTAAANFFERVCSSKEIHSSSAPSGMRRPTATNEIEMPTLPPPLKERWRTKPLLLINHALCTGMVKKAGSRFREPASSLPLSVEASSRSLGPTFFTITREESEYVYALLGPFSQTDLFHGRMSSEIAYSLILGPQNIEQQHLFQLATSR